MLNYHRENVSEIGIDEKTGRRVFVSLVREFRDARLVVDSCCAKLELKFGNRERNDIAYQVFYFGIGPNSTRLLKASLDEYPSDLVSLLVEVITARQDLFRRILEEFQAAPANSEKRAKRSAQLRKVARVTYCPFDGHQSRLGHYFRHLYQTIKFVDGHGPEGKKEQYADILRAQLTNHEQALLCVNAMSSLGGVWLEKGYLVKYSLIKNIPESFFEESDEVNLDESFPGIDFGFDDCELVSDEQSRVRGCRVAVVDQGASEGGKS